MMNESHDQFESVHLSGADARLLDALVEAGFDATALEPMSAEDRLRVQRLVSMFHLLHDYPVDDADDALLDATMARITRYEQLRGQRMRLDPDTAEVAENARRGRRLLRVPLPDFITVAAVLLIATGIGWPLLTSMRQRSIDTACANNLRMTGVGFKQYASDYNDSLPMAEAGLHNTWKMLAHNVMNLSPLVDGGYCDMGHLNCPGHDQDDGESYSYRWIPSGQSTSLTGKRVMVLLGDRNPVIDAARRGSYVSPLSLSLNHGGRGQNVLWSDGSTVWLDQPVVGQDDNIWLPSGVVRLIDGVATDNPSDTFLAH